MTVKACEKKKKKPNDDPCLFYCGCRFTRIPAVILKQQIDEN